MLQAALRRGTHVAGCCWIGNACCRLLLDRECMLQAAAG